MPKLSEEKQQIYALLGKIKKLAEHPNTPQHEAAAAALKYRSLLLKYDIAETELTPTAVDNEFVRKNLKECSRLPSWYRALAIIVAQFMGCAVITSNDYGPPLRYQLSFVGRTRDVERTNDLFHTLLTCFQNSATSHYADFLRKGMYVTVPSPHTYKTSFLHGCATGLHIKIKELEKMSEQYTNDRALVVVKTAAADNYVLGSLKIPEGRPVRRPLVTAHAYRAGMSEGYKARVLPEVEGGL